MGATDEDVALFNPLRDSWAKAVDSALEAAAKRHSLTLPTQALIRRNIEDGILRNNAAKSGTPLDQRRTSLISRKEDDGKYNENVLQELREIINEVVAEDEDSKKKSAYQRHSDDFEILRRSVGLLKTPPSVFSRLATRISDKTPTAVKKNTGWLFNFAANVVTHYTPGLRGVNAPNVVSTTGSGPMQTTTQGQIESHAHFASLVHKMYATTASSLPALVRAKVDDLDLKIDKWINDGRLSEWVCALGRRQRILMSWSESLLHTKELYANQSIRIAENPADTAKFHSMEQSIARLLEDYPDITDLQSIIRNIRGASTLNRSRRTQIWLHGAPGTGKTRFVERLSETLQLPLARVSISDANEALVLLGVAQKRLSEKIWESADYSDEVFMSTIPYHIIRTGCKNLIIFIDEAFGLVSGKFGARDLIKGLFDPDRRSIDTPMIVEGASFDYSAVTFILAANEPLSALKEPALESRFRAIEFGQLADSALDNAMISALEGEPRMNTSPLASTRLGAQGNAAARELARQEIAAIRTMSKECGHKGARPCQRAIETAFNFCVDIVADDAQAVLTDQQRHDLRRAWRQDIPGVPRS